MRFIDNMADAIRHGIRSFLQIDEAPGNIIHIQESMDFNTEAAEKRIWYRGKANELSQFYKAVNGGNLSFWSAVPLMGIRKIHTGVPAMIIDVITAIVMRDMNGISIDDKDSDVWEAMEEENKFKELLGEAVSECLIVGDGAFKLSIDKELSDYPIIEFVSAENIEIRYKKGRLKEIVFKTQYKHNHKMYTLEEVYGYGYIESTLYNDGKEVPLSQIPETADVRTPITFNKSFIMAKPLIIYQSKKYKGRGRSLYDGKTDSFDSLDEAWSQWMDALRKARTKEYIPSDMLPRNPDNGELLKPNAFDNAFIEIESGMGESVKKEIKVIQPAIPHDGYLATYITALDLCLQGVISPSTLGIDTKKLDNADAQREKEKATLYTRNKIIEAIQNTIPEVIQMMFDAYDTLNQTPLSKRSIIVEFGEYANPSFESQVETVGKAKTQGIMSVEASVDELYGDSKDDKWKKEEVARLKAEQGITEIEEPDVNMRRNEFLVQTDNME